jgi:hypothetical protein
MIPCFCSQDDYWIDCLADFQAGTLRDLRYDSESKESSFSLDITSFPISFFIDQSNKLELVRLRSFNCPPTKGKFSF